MGGKKRSEKMTPKPHLDENGVPVSSKKSRRRSYPKDTPEYQERRDRNNVAVRKSRTQTKQKRKETLKHVSQLRLENKKLEQQVQLLVKELRVLKDLFKMSHPMNGAVDDGMEVGIQTDESELGAAEGTAMADHTGGFSPQGLQASSDIEVEVSASAPNIEVNARAMHKDHEYVVKMRTDSGDDMMI